MPSPQKSKLPILPPGFTDGDLLEIAKPAQYLGGELNAVVKNEADVDLRFAICFPDTYEVGMSHLGIQIIYDVLNRDPGVWAERAYMPLPDMEARLREKGAPLFSVESKRPLSEFDLVGFSLQYELCATNILAMLDLGGIPIRASERAENDPLVIGGGPYSYHPEPLAPFFDLFFLGDAEEALAEIVSVVRKLGKSASRVEVLQALDALEGVYVPAFFEPQYLEDGSIASIKNIASSKDTVIRRLLPTMEGAPYPRTPVVPNIRAVHNRLSVEVMRGCVRGCRFCQAGYLYRPQRERSPEEVLEMIHQTLPNTGYEELSLLSLSTADYCSIVPVLKAVMDRYADGDKLAVSFPSTRVDALTPEVLEQVQRVRRTNFTIAPEGGTQRLRDVINKGVADEEILQTCRNVFQMGWSGIKLYFMMGLPTETDEDLMGIVEIARRVKALPEARAKEIVVSVSTFVPKPHTPFQWAEQIDRVETLRRQRLLAAKLRDAKVKFRYHDVFSSFLEGIFCRGGRELAPVVERAYELGCRLDAWSEEISAEKWEQAFLDTGIDPNFYFRARPEQEVFPWDHLSCGISKDYFLKEYRRALRDHVTPDCLKTSCSVCGACDYDVKRNVLWPREETERKLAGTSQKPVASAENVVSRVRLQFEKRGVMKFIGHLELAQIFQRALRRAALPVSYSGGFHPFPRINFAGALQLGIESQFELADLYFYEQVDPASVAALLQANLPEDIQIGAAEQIAPHATSSEQLVIGHRYRVIWLTKPEALLAETDSSVDAETKILQTLDSLSVTAFTREAREPTLPLAREKGLKRKSKRYNREIALRDTVTELHLLGQTETAPLGGIEFRYNADRSRAQARPLEIVQLLSGLRLGEFEMSRIETILAPDTKQVALPSYRQATEVEASV